MSFNWRFEPADKAPELAAEERSFPSQSDAESWVGECWRDLAARGVVAVVLVEEGRVHYSMSLADAE